MCHQHTSHRSDCHRSNQPPSALLSWLVMLVEQQIAERRERAPVAIAKLLERPSGEPYGDYRVQSASGKTYRVAMRGPGLFENYCSCPDFAVNTLGTCKHIEALLLRLGKRYGKTLETAGLRAHAPPSRCSTAKCRKPGRLCDFRFPVILYRSGSHHQYPLNAAAAAQHFGRGERGV